MSDLDQFITHARQMERTLREGGTPRAQWEMVAKAAEKFRNSLPQAKEEEA